MPRDPSGNFNPPSGTLVNSGDTILVSQHNPFVNDVSTALSNSLDRNGTGGMRAPLQMGGNPIQNVAAGSNPNDVATVAQAAANGVPVGAEFFFAGSVAPAGYLFEFGQEVSRTTYASLFAVIGTTYGIGDGLTTFNLPDCRGLTIVGKDDMGGTSSWRLSNFLATTLGAIFGSQSHTLTEAQMPSHNHGGATGSNGDHNHTLTLPATGNAGAEVATAKFNAPSSSNLGNATGTTSTTGAHNHTVSSQGGGLAHNNVQPSTVRNIIIKAQ